MFRNAIAYLLYSKTVFTIPIINKDCEAKEVSVYLFLFRVDGNISLCLNYFSISLNDVILQL